MKTPITETQVRAARELLRWDQKKLANEASLGLATIRRYELGKYVAEETTAELVAALEKAGVLFINESTINGIAVSGAVALRAWAQPETRPPTREYNYKPETTPGRPKKTLSKKKST